MGFICVINTCTHVFTHTRYNIHIRICKYTYIHIYTRHLLLCMRLYVTTQPHICEYHYTDDLVHGCVNSIAHAKELKLTCIKPSIFKLTLWLILSCVLHKRKYRTHAHTYMHVHAHIKTYTYIRMQIHVQMYMYTHDTVIYVHA